VQIRVATLAGAVHGFVSQQSARPVAAFLGVPFAAPPVAERRFAAPVPPEPRSGEREALAFGPAPPQLDDPLLQLLGSAAGEQSEDCLSLNVWTPDPGEGSSGGRPVLVWLHGGAFISGTGGVPLYDGGHLSARGDVVVVTLNYRVGALGFLYLDGSEGGPACSNLGLRDQIAALAWVRANIANFGGDPERVCVFGQSAGAGSLCALLAAPAARGLFRAAIVQSASPDGYITPDEARERSARFLQLLGRPAAELREVPVDALLEAQQRAASERQWKTGMLFPPVIDGELLPARPMAAIRDGEAAPVPLVIGTTRDELKLFEYLAPRRELSPEAAKAALAQRLPADLVERLYELYRSAREARGESLAGVDIMYAILTDLAIRGPSIRLAEHHARHAPTFMYLFEWSSPFADGELGSFHALDVPFVFGHLDQPGVARLTGEGEAAQRLSEQMMDAWVAFARSGDPSTAALGDWPRYDAEVRATMILGRCSRVVDAPREPERRALAELVAATTP
jgi:para-nitrobenzyl esterase